MKLFQLARSLAKKNSVKEGTLVLIDQGTMSLVNFLVGLFLARAVNKEEFAIYVLAWSVLYFLLGIQRALVVIPLTVYLPRHKNHEQHLYIGSSSFLALLLACAVLVVILLLQSFSENDSLTMRGALPILVWTAVPFLLRDYARSILLAKLRFKQSVVGSLASSFFLLGGTGWMFLSETLSTGRAFMVIAATQALAFIWMISSERIHLELNFQRLVNTFMSHWKMSKWIFINTLGYLGSAQAYPWIILYFLGAESVAIFGVISAFASLPSPVLRALNAYLLPKMAHGSVNDHGLTNLQRLLWRSMSVLAIPFGVWLVLSILFGNQIVIMLYSAKYGGNGLLIGLIVAAGMISSVSTPQITALQALERPDVSTIGTLASALLAIVCGCIVIVPLGLTGIGIVSIVAGLAAAAVRAHGLRILFRRAKADLVSEDTGKA